MVTFGYLRLSKYFNYVINMGTILENITKVKVSEIPNQSFNLKWLKF